MKVIYKKTDQNKPARIQMSLFAVGSCMVLVLLYLAKIAGHIDKRELAYKENNNAGHTVVISPCSDETMPLDNTVA
jgi:hypothetical protein